MRFPILCCTMAAAWALAASATAGDDQSVPETEAFSEAPAPRLLEPLEANPLNTLPHGGGQRDDEVGAATIQDTSDVPPATRRAAARSLPARMTTPKAVATQPVAAQPVASDMAAPAEQQAEAIDPVLTPAALPVAAPAPLVEASRLKGIQPGTSTSAEVRLA